MASAAVTATFLVKVANYTNVQMSLAHSGMWQVPVREVGPQPRDLINACLARNEEVQIVVALEGARQLAGYARVREAVPVARPGGKTSTIALDWLCVFRQRGPLLPYVRVSDVAREDGTAVCSLPSYSQLSPTEAAALRDALHGAVAAAQEAAQQRHEQSLAVEHVPLSSQVVAQVLERVAAQCGQLLFACWSGAARYGVSCAAGEDALPPLFIVFRAPLERVLSVRQPLLQVAGPPVFLAVEVGAFCTAVSQGQVESVEVLFVEKGLFEDPSWAAVRQLGPQLVAQAVPKLVDSLLACATGRAGLKGARIEVGKVGQDAVRTMQLHKRLAHVERLLLQVQELETASKLVVALSPEQSQRIMQDYSHNVTERLANAEALLKTLGAARQHVQSPVAASFKELGEWLLQQRLASAPADLPGPLGWKDESSMRVLQACPWPLLVLGKRAVPGASKQIVGVFAGNVRQWLASPAGIEAGDRGWGELCVRSEAAGYVLYELGRFAEMLVWGNPFVLEMLFLPQCRGGEVLHGTREWTQLVAMASDLVTARAIMQVMSAVQAQLKRLLEAGTPFHEDQVALADLLYALRKLVVAKVGPSDAGDTFNEFQFWREPIDDIAEQVVEEEEHKQETKKADPRDGPACIPTGPNVTVEANFDIDKTGLRECLVELDELRPKWTRGVLPEAVAVQKKLDDWLIPMRLACLK